MTRGRELDVLRREGKRVRTEHLDVRVLASLPAFVPPGVTLPGVAPSGAELAARVGIIVPKHKHSGVERNLVKRRLRELARLRLLPVLPGGAVLLRARPEAYGAGFDALGRDVERAGREAVRWLQTRPAAPAVPQTAPTDAPPGITLA